MAEYGFPDTDFELLARSAGRTLGRFMLTPVLAREVGRAAVAV